MSLNKAELEYEVGIRGDTPAGTVKELQKQITKLAPLFPSEDVLISCYEPDSDLLGLNTVLGKIATVLDSDVLPDKNTLLRTQNLLHHVYHRLNRIEPTDTQTTSMKDSYILKFKRFYQQYNSIKDNVVDPLDTQSGESESTTPLNIKVTCERGISSEITKFKFNGKTCVRTFIQHITEFCNARNIDDSKLLSFCTEIFTGDALHWYRSVKDSVKGWNDLVALLNKDFGQVDYDYRLISEIRARTQGETENITIYLSIMAGMFSRLSKPMPEEEKLEIILHNIRPIYTSTLAAIPEVKSIDSLKTICRNYENYQARLAHFHEPTKPTADTLAPEFAYAGSSNQNKYSQKQSYNQNKFNQNQNNNQNQNKSNVFYKNTNHNSSYRQNYTNRGTKYENLDAIYSNTANDKKPFCPRCRVDTHHLRQCTANRDIVFCFVCGQKGVKTPQCPKCSKTSRSPSGSKN